MAPLTMFSPLNGMSYNSYIHRYIWSYITIHHWYLPWYWIIYSSFAISCDINFFFFCKSMFWWKLIVKQTLNLMLKWTRFYQVLICWQRSIGSHNIICGMVVSFVIVSQHGFYQMFDNHHQWYYHYQIFWT